MSLSHFTSPSPSYLSLSSLSPNLSLSRPTLTPIKISCCSGSSAASTSPPPSPAVGNPPPPPPPPTRVQKKRTRYRKQYPGEKEGVAEEMRFVAMRLRNVHGNKVDDVEDEGEGGAGGGDTWRPSVEGFVRFLVDSKVVFNTVERIVDESDNVSYAYFRKTGLERSMGLSKDLEWFSQQDIAIPTPSSPGISYAKYLEELAEKSAPLFLCHLYNIYFSHVAGGQVIAKQVSEKLFEGKELQFCTWEENDEELLKSVRDKLKMLGEHWTRDEKNKCLREATKAFRYLGQIVRLIIL